MEGGSLRLFGKAAVVTGGGRGIGAASARALAQAGAKVLVTDIDSSAARDVAKLIRGAGGHARAERLDVTDEQEVNCVFDKAIEGLGSLDVVMNNAGVCGVASIVETTAEEWHRTLDVNLTGVFFGCKAAMARMRRTGGGVIINTGSISSVAGWKDYGAYSASKAGVLLLTKVAALEGARENIRVNAILPGSIDTEMVRELIAKDGVDRESAYPMGRLGRPEEVAMGVVYLASDESPFMTGACLTIDGGFTAG